MDSWMPWKITCNFIRAFFPTLSLLIVWDLCRNLGHASAMQQQTMLIDAIALCAILAIRLQPPVTQAWEQLKYPFRLGSMSILAVGTLLMALLDPRKLSFLVNGPAVVGYIFYCDLSRTCKISLADAERRVDLVHAIVGGSGWIAWSIVSSPKEMGTLPWRDALFLAIFFLVLIAISAFKWWGEWDRPFSHIQELGLDREIPDDPNP